MIRQNIYSKTNSHSELEKTAKEEQFIITEEQESQTLLSFITSEKPSENEFIFLFFRGVAIPSSDFTISDNKVILDAEKLPYKAEKGDTISIYYKYNI